MSARRIASVLGAAALLALGAGCGGDDDDGGALGALTTEDTVDDESDDDENDGEDDTEADADDTDADDTDADADDPADDADDPVDDAEESDDPADDTEEAPAGPGDAVAFDDPDGEFTIGAGPDWTIQENPAGTPAGITVWSVAPPGAAGFTPNVNALVQPSPTDDVEGYLDFSEAQADNTPGVTEVELLDRRTVGDLGILEYTGTVQGNDLQFLGVVAVGNGTAVLVTFTADPAEFDALVGDVEPYMLTLAQT